MVNEAPPGRVQRIEVTGRHAPGFGGASFGAAGPYEYLTARAQCELDPLHRLNRGIVNLDRAPRNAAGMVEYTVDVAIAQPVDPARANGWLFHEVLNRGGKRAIHRVNDAPASNDLLTEADAGNGFLMRSGFTVVWVAWQGDALPGMGRMQANFPVAVQDGNPIIGRCRDEIIADAPGTVRDELIADTSATTFSAILSHAAASLDPAAATLTIRQNERDPRVTPPGLSWRYLDERRIEVTRPPGFDRGAIYEFVFQARDPVVMGIGFAAVRDVVGFLRTGGADPEDNANPVTGAIRHALLFGLSQSGRMVRDYLYQGFNEGAAGRPVFEAMMPVIAGSRRMFMNEAFAQTSRYPRQHEDHAYPGDQFPFTYTRLADPLSGREDGVLERAIAAGVCPKLMHVDTDSEMWSARGSLVVTDTAGRDIDLPGCVRAYLLSGLPHGGYKAPSAGVTRNAANPLTYGSQLRALIAALLRWVEDDAAPPPSCYPSRAAGTLVTLAEAASLFPSIPGVAFPAVLNVLHVTDHAQEPPAEGAAYPVFVAATDADGNGVGGVRHPLMMAPIGAYTGWNLRAAGYAPGELYSIAGSALPFALTQAAREASGDPRLSVAERYRDHAAWVQALEAACTTLMADGFLLQEDRERLLGRAAEGWDVETAI